MDIQPIPLEVQSLYDALGDYQRRNNVDDGQLAERLGISRSYWSVLRMGRKRFTPELGLRVVRRFPEHRALVAAALRIDPYVMDVVEIVAGDAVAAL